MRLATARKIAKLTQTQLADLAGVEQSTISQIENGKIERLSYTAAVRIARALGVEPEELFPVPELDGAPK